MPMRLTPYGRERFPLPGVPWRDLDDEEWAAAQERHPGIEAAGYFEPGTTESIAPGGGGGAGGTGGRVEILSTETWDGNGHVETTEAAPDAPEEESDG